MRGTTVIFSRDRGSGRHKEPRRSAAEADRSTGRAAKRRRPTDPATTDDSTIEAATSDTDEELATGPYDISEAPEGVERLDLGSLHIPVVDGVSVRVQANDDGVIQQIALMHDDSALMLSVLAAPRNESVWDEARADIRKELSAGGGSVEDIPDGEFGPELRARIKTPEGEVELRFVGVDGPRWLVRAIFQGPAALDPAASPLLLDSLHGLVVDRGRDAMPVMDVLPLRLPREIAEQARAQAAAAEASRPATNGVVPGSDPTSASDARASRPGNVS
jgi:uncharacterized protein DUF3710